VLRIAFQGEFGAFSERAIAQLWGSTVVTVPCPEVVDVLGAVARGEVDAGVLPIENVSIGPIPGIAETLAAFPRVRSVDETQVAIHPCVLGIPGTSLDALRRVSSHPAALSQCADFLRRHPWIEPVAASDTAGSARAVHEGADPTAGAIAAREAAERYGLAVLAADVADRPDNATRFVAVARV
jgi:prephenate dehydratase